MWIESNRWVELPFNMSALQTENFTSKKKDFANYLLSRPNGVIDVDRDTSLWKYLRTMRFYEKIHTACLDCKLPLHLQWMITLAMQESKWDPLSRNLQNWWWSDWWWWLFHTQPDTAKRTWLSLYSDKVWTFKKPVRVDSYIARNYKECDYRYLTKEKKLSHQDAYKIHGAWLVQLKEDLRLRKHCKTHP